MNPKREYNTPLGIYCYPLWLVWEDYVKNTLPFALNRKYIQLLYSDKLFDIDGYKENDLKKDEEILKKKYHNEIDKYDGFVESYKIKAKDCSSIGYIWNITRMLSEKTLS